MTAACHGDARRRRLFAAPRYRAWHLLLALACAWAGLAEAGPLYRCAGANGDTVFTGATAGYHQCKPLAGFSTPAHKPAMRVAGAASFKQVTSAATSAAAIPPPPSGAATVAVVPAALPSRAPPGHWSYSDSHDGDPAARQGEAHALASVSAPAPAAADRVLRGAVYRVTRADGTVEYTNLQPPQQKGRAVTMLFTYISTCVACNLRSPINWNTVALDLGSYAAAIRAASAEFGVDEALLRAVIHAESAFNPRALSIKGAQGLMQLMPGTAGDMGVRDAFDAEQNIRGGARYLALLLRDFRGDERLAAAAYNAGERAVQRYNGVPPYAETQVYVERVGTLRRRYGAASQVTRPAAG